MQEEHIRVLPSELSKPPLLAVTDVIQQRFFDRVVPQLGLVVTLYDVQSIEGGFIYPNDGAAYFRVRFRLVVFRPFVGEILVGRLRACTRNGIHVSLGDFFEDVFIPEHALQEPSFFNDAEKLWVWKFDGTNRPLHQALSSLLAHAPLLASQRVTLVHAKGRTGRLICSHVVVSS
jgi:DNA-directed RNA polymerase subunit E'/Rpb7